MNEPTTPADRIRNAIRDVSNAVPPLDLTHAESRMSDALQAAAPGIRARLGDTDYLAVVRSALAAGRIEALDAVAQAASPRARKTDPATSRAAEGPRFRHGTHLHRLLRAWASTLGNMTSEEAADLVDLLGTEYAKRASELHRLGLIDTVPGPDGEPRTRIGASGRERLIYRATSAGEEYCRRLDRHT